MLHLLLLLLTSLAAAILAALAVLLAARLTHPRPRGPFPASHSLPPRPGAPLTRALAARLPSAPDQSAVQLLQDPIDALAARLELLRMAQVSVDLQYYIWQDDTSGGMMCAALLEAAARGVRVRLLLDDNGTYGLDRTLAILAHTPNIEVRLFNPFPLRRFRALGYLSDFRRLNRRMHNKAMIADGQVAILGGRNIGDIYFNTLGPEGLYLDMDVAISGPSLPEAARQFDRYWNSPLSVPADLILPPPHADDLAAEQNRLAARLATPRAQRYAAALQSENAAPLFGGAALPVHWAKAHILADTPEKMGKTRTHGPDLVWQTLLETIGQPQRELALVSPYFVPTRAGVKALRRYAASGVKVRILTNSLASTDVPVVHSGYAHRRRPLLRAGVELYEYAPDVHPARRKLTELLGPEIKGTSPFSRNKLHAKVFAVDRARVFVGSFNFDPRSMRLNTENGVLLEAPELTEDITAMFEATVQNFAWRVTIARNLRLRWARAGEPVQTREPGTRLGTRILLGIAQRLPIEWML